MNTLAIRERKFLEICILTEII